MFHEDPGKESRETIMMAESPSVIVAPRADPRPEDTPPPDYYEYTFDPLPPSPSMTPPASAEGPSESECESEDEVELNNKQQTQATNDDICDDDDDDPEEVTLVSSLICDSPTSSNELSSSPPSPSSTSIARNDRPERRSIRRGRNTCHRLEPYYQKPKASSSLPTTTVLRPLNHQRSKVEPSGGVTSCHASTASSPPPSEQVVVVPSSLSSNSSISSSNVEPLHVDTRLANRQSVESHQAKTRLARQILALIRADDFVEFQTMLSRMKPDLNVFVDGQTALHYCLLLGRDVSWCKQLVSAGANPNLSNRDGWHPLHLAAFKGLRESLAYLTSCNHHHHHHQHHSNNSNTNHSNNSNNQSPSTTSSASQHLSPTRG